MRRTGASVEPITTARPRWTEAARKLRGASPGSLWATQTASAAAPSTNRSRNVSFVISPQSTVWHRSGRNAPSMGRTGPPHGLAKEVALFGDDELAGAALAPGVETPDHRRRGAGGLAHH